MKAKHGAHEPNPVRGQRSDGGQFVPGLLLSMALLIGLVVPPTAFATGKGNASAMTVLVFNFRQVPGEVLANAENEAGRIFERAGVYVSWRDCPTGSEPCPKGAGYVLLLAIMAGPIQIQLDVISGRADPAVRLAAVYYDYLPRQPGGFHNSSEIASVLAGVIGHELGHLLLGARGHSLSGIMRESWDSEQTRLALISQLSFLPEETEILQSVLREGIPPRSGTVSGLVPRR